MTESVKDLQSIFLPKELSFLQKLLVTLPPRFLVFAKQSANHIICIISFTLQITPKVGINTVPVYIYMRKLRVTALNNLPKNTHLIKEDSNLGLADTKV